jgi:hypothetical protein
MSHVCAFDVHTWNVQDVYSMYIPAITSNENTYHCYVQVRELCYNSRRDRTQLLRLRKERERERETLDSRGRAVNYAFQGRSLKTAPNRTDRDILYRFLIYFKLIRWLVV